MARFRSLFLVYVVSGFVAGCSVPLPGDRALTIERASSETRSCSEIAMEMTLIEDRALALIPEARRESAIGRASTGFDQVIVWPALALLVTEENADAFNSLRRRHDLLERESESLECGGPSRENGEHEPS